jgi:3-oxoacyl-[acyl-carrier protein] reductase
MNNNLSLEELNDFVENIPLGRMGEASEVAELIYFLCSDAADYITGQVISQDGGIAI